MIPSNALYGTLSRSKQRPESATRSGSSVARDSMKWRTSQLLPMPDSPCTTTVTVRPARASS